MGEWTRIGLLRKLWPGEGMAPVGKLPRVVFRSTDERCPQRRSMLYANDIMRECII